MAWPDSRTLGARVATGMLTLRHARNAILNSYLPHVLPAPCDQMIQWSNR